MLYTQRNEANETNKLNSNACLSFHHTFHMHNMPKHTSIYIQLKSWNTFVRSRQSDVADAAIRDQCEIRWLMSIWRTEYDCQPDGLCCCSRFCQEIDSESNEDRQPRRQECTTTRLHETAEIVGPGKSNEHCRRAERASLSAFQLWILHCENV